MEGDAPRPCTITEQRNGTRISSEGLYIVPDPSQGHYLVLKSVVTGSISTGTYEP
jgi:hypothetical protein